MGDPYKGRLAGHALLNEGKTAEHKNGPGNALCTCGWTMFCVSTYDRQKEHRQHKADVLDSWVANGCDDKGREIHL